MANPKEKEPTQEEVTEQERGKNYAGGRRGLEKGTGDAGQEQIQKATDEAEEKGFIGVSTDPRPNTDYSLEGGAPVDQK